jgi:hypothetical protein
MPSCLHRCPAAGAFSSSFLVPRPAYPAREPGRGLGSLGAAFPTHASAWETRWGGVLWYARVATQGCSL